MKNYLLQIGQIDLSFHRVTAAIVLAKLDAIGQKYQLHTAPHEKLFEKYRNGDIDMVLGAWLPSSHGKYIKEVEKDTLKLSTLYRPFCLWGVPDYVSGEVASVADLVKPSVVNKFNATIQGINEGAGISRFSRNIIHAYGLDKLGFEFKSGSISAFANAFENAYKEREWVIVPIWKPQYLFYSYNIRSLKEPKGLLGTVDHATVIIHKDAVSKLKPEALTWLKNVTFSNDQVTALDYQYQVEQKTLQAIAATYTPLAHR